MSNAYPRIPQLSAISINPELLFGEFVSQKKEPVMNDFAKQFFNDCQDISNNLITTGQNLFASIEDDILSKRRLRDAEEMLSNYEAELLHVAAIQAIEKTGPLAGLAATSSVYKSACEAYLAKNRKSDPYHADLHNHVAKLRNQSDEVTILREGTAVTFSALKHAADLRAAMLRSMEA